jgi:prepilin-type processing-associated H-X9-DG protein
VQQARESARGLACRNNMNQLGKALLLYENNFGRYPGYVESIGNNPELADQQRRGSWVVMVFPYMEEQNAYDRWKDFHEPVTPPVPALNCHSDPPDITDSPSLSYVVNVGRSPGDNSQPSQPPIRENLADGMFFDRSCPPLASNGNKGAKQPRDARQQAGGVCTMLEMSGRYLDSHDGNSKTLMISENVHTLFYAYSITQTGAYDLSERLRDDKQFFGFVWSNQPQAIERINGDNEAVLDSSTGLMALTDHYSHAWPSSRHPGYVNVGYADGHVDKMEETIETTVYRQLMTTRAKASTDVSRDLLTN